MDDDDDYCWEDEDDYMDAWDDDDGYGVDGEESGTRVTEEEELVEGGDFHLRSALREESDMEENLVYEKEKKRIVEDIGSIGNLIDHIQATAFLSNIGARINEDKSRTTLAQHLQEGGFDVISREENIKLIKAELMIVSPRLSHADVDNSISGALSQFHAAHPSARGTINLILVLLSLLNNVKNIRKGIELHPVVKSCMYMVKNTVALNVAVATICYLSTDLLVFDIDGVRSYMPKPYFLNACDKAQERFNVMLYSYLAHGLSIPGCCSPDKVNQVIKWGDSVLAALGNDGYDVLASYEALLVGLILDRDDPELLPTSPSESFLNAILKDADDIAQKFMMSLISIVKYCTPAQLSDLHGLYRIWGHPVINIDGGVRKLQKVTQEDKGDIDSKPESKDAVRSFRRLFCIEYFRKHSIYPPYKMDPKINNYLGNCLRTNKEVDERHINYNYEDWDHIFLEQAFSIPYSWNVLHLAKDKAISPSRSEVFYMLIQKGKIFNAALKRGVLKLMDTVLIPLRDFLLEVADRGLDIDDCIIGLFPKERELKIMARFFSLLSFKMRLYFTATEELLGSKVLKYFPQITMSSNLLEMQEKMAEMSKNLSSQSRTVTYVLNMDFVKWNQQMRESICRGVFTELDRIFGVPGLYTRSHQIFKDSILYIADGTRVLDPDPTTGIMINGTTCWLDQGAGKEGIRQKAWTIMTVCDIATVARNHPGKFHLVGGGDNQVLTITYTTNQVDTKGDITTEGKEKIKSKVKRFIQALEAHFSSRGLPLKTSETWCSTSLFMYNKYMYYKGAPLRSPLKQVSRLFPFSNNTAMTLQSMSQCLGTGLRSVGQKEISHIPSLVMRNLWGSILAWIVTYCHPMLPSISAPDCIKGNASIMRGKKEVIVRVEQVSIIDLAIRIIYLPSSLGGPGFVNILQLMMRGFPDPCTEGIFFLKSLHLHAVQIGAESASTLGRMKGVSFSKGKNYEPLIEDVCSLNTDAPRSGTSEQREVAKKILLKSKLGGNNNLRDLINLMAGNSEKEFYRSLSSAPVLDVRVLHEIASASLFAVTNTFTSRVDRTATLKRLTLRYNMLKNLAEAEIKFLRYLLVRDNKMHDIMFTGCSRVLADRCRTLGWGKQVIGVTVPTPFEYLSFTDLDNHECDNDHIVLRMSSGNRVQLTEVLGPCKPYLGTYTKEKFKMTEIAAAYGDEDVLSKSLRLMKIINWRYDEDSVMSDVLRAPFTAVTDIDPDRMVQETSVTKGDYDHRRKMDSRVHGGIPNFVVTPLSHMSICTSTWHTHARGGKNENIHFQACIIKTMYQAMMEAMVGCPMSEVYHSHEICPECIVEIQAPDPNMVTPVQVVNFPSLVGNQLVYVPEQAIEFDYSRMQEVEYARRVGTMDCHRCTDYIWVDTYSSLSWLIMCDVIGWTRMPKSFYLMAKENVDHYLLSMYIIAIWKVMKNEHDLANKRLDWDPLIKVYSTVSGIKVLTEVMGIVLTGSLEGGLSVDMKDICEIMNSLKVSQIPPISVNLALPKVHKQAALWWGLTFGDMYACIECVNNLNGYWDGTSINTRIDNDLRCHRHADGETQPRIINAHISNLSGGLIKVLPGMEQHENVTYIAGEDNPGLIQIPSIVDEWPDPECVSILSATGEEIDMDGRILMLLETICLIMPDIIVVTPEINIITTLSLIYERIHMNKSSLTIVHIMVERPAYLESDSIFEMESTFPSSATLSFQYGYREVPEGLHRLWVWPSQESLPRVKTGDWVVITLSEMIKYGSQIEADVVFSLKEKRLGRNMLYQKGSGKYQPGALFELAQDSSFNVADQAVRTRDYEINKIINSSPGMGGKYMLLKRRCSWALFSNRYELLTAVEHIKKKMTVDGVSMKNREWSRTHREDVLILLISMLSRAEDADEGELMTLSYVECDIIKMTLSPRFNKRGTVSIRYLDYFWFFKRMYMYEERKFDICYIDVRRGVNIGSPQKDGYNVIGT